MLDPGAVPMADPLAFLLTWTTYGTWLPGDERGWYREREGWHRPDPKVLHEARRKLTESPLLLTDDQRSIVEDTIRQHCQVRGWKLLAVNCRTNHVHVVVAAPGYRAEVLIDQFKSWCTRRLKEHAIGSESSNTNRLRWWTEGGSRRFLNDERSVEGAVCYVLEAQ